MYLMLWPKHLQLYILILIMQVASQPDSARGSRLLEFLESEKQKAAQRIEEVKQRRSEMMSITRRNGFLESGKTDLYKVALLLREANKISQLLKKHTVSTLVSSLIKLREIIYIKKLKFAIQICLCFDFISFSFLSRHSVGLIIWKMTKWKPR